MLSNCQQCKYHNPDLCAVNPSYKVMQAKLRSRLSEDELEACEVGILPCTDWEPSEELQPLTLVLTVSRQEWKQVLNSALPRELFAQIQTAIAQGRLEAIAQPGEILMVPVDSSNIAAIGYDPLERILRVDFLSDTTYHYYGVPSQVFNEFQLAYSKGRFLNSDIKGVFDYQRVS